MEGEFGKRITITKTAEILEYFIQGKKYVVKLFHAFIPNEIIEHEYKLTQIIAKNATFPISNCHGIIEHRNRKGIILDFITGKSIISQLVCNPFSLKKIIEKIVETHFQIHTLEIDELDTLEKRLKIILQNSSKTEFENITKTLTYYHTLDHLNSLCHGDFHFKNIIVKNNKKLCVIDWLDAHKGNPYYDVCRTYILFKMPSKSNCFIYHKLVSPLKKHIAETYLMTYNNKRKTNKTDVLQWLPIVIEILKTEDLKKHQLKWLEKENLNLNLV